MLNEDFVTEEKETVCFTGHRVIDESEANEVYSEIEKAISKGYKTFLSGGAKGFDNFAGLAVLNLKEKYSDIKLIMILPFKKSGMLKYLENKDKEILEYLCDEADAVIELSKRHHKDCFRDRNFELANRSSYCIAYCKRKRSGTAQTIRFMREKGGFVSNIVNPPENF